MKTLLFSLLIVNSFQTGIPPLTSFAIGKYAGTEVYANDLNINKTLTLPEAQAIQITVEGEVEDGYDFLTLYDSKRKKIRRLTGRIQEQFTIKGSTLYLNFYSDARTKSQGVQVTLSSSSMLNEVKTRLIDASQQILKGGTKEAYQRIVAELAQLIKLQTLVKTQPLDTLIEQVITRLMAITKIYRDIGNNSQDILALHHTQFHLIEELNNEVIAQMNTLQQDREKYLLLLNQSQNNLGELLSEMDRQKEQLSMEVYQKVLIKLDLQQKNWKTFKSDQALLESTLKKYSEAIGLFLYFLQVNAQLYEQAANMLLMKKNSLAELKELVNLKELQKIVDDIVHQEEAIQARIHQIQQTKPDESK